MLRFTLNGIIYLTLCIVLSVGQLTEVVTVGAELTQSPNSGVATGLDDTNDDVTTKVQDKVTDKITKAAPPPEDSAVDTTAAPVEDDKTTESEQTSTAIATTTTTTTTTTEKPMPLITITSIKEDLEEGFMSLDENGNYEGLIIDVMNKISKEMKFEYNISESGSIETGEVQMEFSKIDTTKTDLSFTQEMTMQMQPEEESNFHPDLFLIFKPFTTGVWLLILFAFFLIGLSLFMFNICHPHEHMAAASRGKSSNHDARYFHIQGSYWTAFSTLMLQGYERKPRTCAGRILLGFWFLFVIFTVVLYIASMFNILSASHQIVEEEPEKPCHPGENFAFAFSKDNNDLQGIDDSVKRLKDNGDMLNMQKNWFNCPPIDREKRNSDMDTKTIHMQIGLNSFSGAIIILVIGLIFAILVALLEVCCYKNKHKQVPTSHTKENLLSAEEGQATNDISGIKDATEV